MEKKIGNDYKWILTEVADPNLTESEIKNIINTDYVYGTIAQD